MTSKELEQLYNAICRSPVANDGVGYFIRLSVNDRERIASCLYELMVREKNREDNNSVPAEDWTKRYYPHTLPNDIVFEELNKIVSDKSGRFDPF